MNFEYKDRNYMLHNLYNKLRIHVVYLFLRIKVIYIYLRDFSTSYGISETKEALQSLKEKLPEHIHLIFLNHFERIS